MERLAYRAAELARAAGLSERAIRDEIRAGRLPVHRHGRAVLILERDARAWLESLPTSSATPLETVPRSARTLLDRLRA